MRLLTPSLALLLLLVPLDDLWIEPVQASIFSSAPSSEVAPSCGPSYEACPVSSPCCNNGTCHETSLMACSMSLGCEPRYSHPLDDKSSSKKKNKKKSKRGEDNDEEYEDDGDPRSCFPLPVCRSFKETFKHNDADKKGQHKLLVPKLDFVGDPDLAHWTSEFDHIAPNAVVDPKQKRLVLKAKRDTVKTQSGGGFGATISSTRWNLYGSFSAKLKSGATGPGIVTAMMLSNPMRGEEITIEVTGRDPHTVVTDFYSHSARDSHSSKGTGSWLPSLNLKSVVPSMDGLRVRTRKLKAMILPKTQEKKNKEHDQDEDEKEEEVEEDNSLEESHALKRSAVDHDLVYKI
ncbi:hypothetical protein BC939DRAFT_508398, partial [Gamsiella multidivaricata]|uniref:uncharacterized protein n=1 Tax=Gamsiella multidivaricata TaxID=101098 RepID=UPI002220B744